MDVSDGRRSAETSGYRDLEDPRLSVDSRPSSLSHIPCQPCFHYHSLRHDCLYRRFKCGTDLGPSSCGQASTTTTDSARQMDGCGHDESTSVASTSRMRYMASYPSTQHLIHLAHRWRTPFYAVHPSGSQLDLHNFRPSGIRVRPDSIQASLR